jgi:hypothetical protein
MSTSEALKNDLTANAKTLEDIFTILGKYYDVPGTKLGYISKALLIKHIDTFIAASGAKPKK